MHFRHFTTWRNASSAISSRGILAVRLLLSATLVIGVVTGPATAQSASFRSVDRSGDGVLTHDELVAAFGREGADRLLRSMDHNGDARITILELRRGAHDGRDDDDRDDDRDDGDNDDDGSDDDGDDDD